MNKPPAGLYRRVSIRQIVQYAPGFSRADTLNKGLDNRVIAQTLHQGAVNENPGDFHAVPPLTIHMVPGAERNRLLESSSKGA
jgi:hypothetical protein